MAKGREIQCIYYICEGNCDLGKAGTFRKLCQTCPVYKKKRVQGLLELIIADKKLKR